MLPLRKIDSLTMHGHTPLFRRMAQILGRSISFAEKRFNHEQAQLACKQHGLVNLVAARSLAHLTKIYSSKPLTRVGGGTPRIAIVGGGMAGLNAAYVLRQSGYPATVYEAAQRTGGRIRTVHDELAKGIHSELGGEFIDTSHLDMRALANAFKLSLIDTQEISEQVLEPAYFFSNRHRSEKQVVDAFIPLAERIAADNSLLSVNITARRHTAADVRFDTISVADYLDKIGATGWMRDLINVAYVTEFGLDADQISAIELISMIGTDTGSGFHIFGESDQRFKIRGGNERITQALSRLLGSYVVLEHRLVSIRGKKRAFQLTFETPCGTQVVNADWVILALPFSILREIDTGDLLPPLKRNIVTNLGYGSNAKLLVGLNSRPWRGHGFNGDVYSDNAFQTGWDSSRLQRGTQGVFTYYLGGTSGTELGNGLPMEYANQFSDDLDYVYPGFKAVQTQAVLRIHWPSEPFIRGSYSCHQPGQWTGMAGEVGRRIGNLLFAGEHCSTQFQGYMNGAAETGRHAAQNIIAALR